MSLTAMSILLTANGIGMVSLREFSTNINWNTND
jgi:hypothetical protein